MQCKTRISMQLEVQQDGMGSNCRAQPREVAAAAAPSLSTGFFPSGRSEGQPSPLFADTAAAASTLLHDSTHTRECDIALDGHDNDDCAAFFNQKTGDGAACGGLIANPMHLCASTHMTEFMGRSCGECGEEVELK